MNHPRLGGNGEKGRATDTLESILYANEVSVVDAASFKPESQEAKQYLEITWA